MEIKKLIDDYTKWLRQEITFEKIGTYYEITTPFLDNKNDYIQLYIQIKDDNIYFSDDGFTINNLLMSGLQLTATRKDMLRAILRQYGVSLQGNTLEAVCTQKKFAQKQHMFVQAIMKITDLYMTARSKNISCFLEDVQGFFESHDIYYTDNVEFTGKSGFSHNYDFLLQRSKTKPERLCRLVNQPNKYSMANILFAWNDTKPVRRDDSRLIVLLNDSNKIAKGVEEGFLEYDAQIIKWTQISNPDNMNLLTA